MSLIQPFKDLITNVYIWLAGVAFFGASHAMEAMTAKANSLPFLLVFSIPFLMIFVFVVMAVLLATRAAAQSTQHSLPFFRALGTVYSACVKMGLLALPFSLFILWLQFQMPGKSNGWYGIALLFLKEALGLVSYVLTSLCTGIALAQGSSKGALRGTFRFLRARGIVTPLIFGFLLLLFQLLPHLVDWNALRECPMIARILSSVALTVQIGCIRRPIPATESDAILPPRRLNPAT